MKNKPISSAFCKINFNFSLSQPRESAISSTIFSTFLSFIVSISAAISATFSVEEVREFSKFANLSQKFSFVWRSAIRSFISPIVVIKRLTPDIVSLRLSAIFPIPSKQVLTWFTMFIMSIMVLNQPLPVTSPMTFIILLITAIPPVPKIDIIISIISIL